MPVTPLMSLEFRKRYALWSRLEPRCRSTDFADGLAARVADPLWLLARQWQLGELAAADAGSPVRADLEYRTTPLSHARLGASPETALEDAPPLETLVERERASAVRDQTSVEYRMRVRAGQRLERELRRPPGTNADALIRGLRKRYPLRLPALPAQRANVDRATHRYVSLMEGRVVDGVNALAAAATPAGVAAAAAAIGATGDDAQRVTDAFAQLRLWYSQLLTQPPGVNRAWVPEKLAYSFGVSAADDATALTAPQYRNGDLDWHSFSLVKAPTAFVDGTTTKSPFLPTGLAFGGMPNRRWWAFEDSRVDLGGLDASTTDLAKLALVEFALIYADDWFMYPLVVPAGSVTRIRTLEVTDSFGREKLIERGRTQGTTPWDRWEMYTLSPAASTRAPGHEQVLLVPPAVGFREESEPLEVVRFARDEGANKVWGIERTITNALGDGVGGPGAHRERLELRRELPAAAAPAAAGPVLTDAELSFMRYKIQTYLPYNWIPFAPVRLNRDGTSIRLVRASMLLNEDSKAAEAIPGLSQLLKDERSLNEETVLRQGLTVQLTRQRVRWTDGSTYVWIGRGVRTGRGEASSGLRFDVVTTREP